MPDVVYVPVLKGRQGELSALALISPETRRAVLPVLEVVRPDSDDQVSAREAIDKLVKRLHSWGGESVVIDTGPLPAEMEVASGFGPSGYAVTKAADSGLDAVPVVRLADGERARTDVRTAHDNFGGGVAVRLGAEDLDEDPADVDDALTALLHTIHLGRDQADLLLDLGAVQGDIAVRAGARAVADVLRELSRVDEWRRIAVVSGAFPLDLTHLPPWTFAEPPRSDAALWDLLRRRRQLPRVPLHGDYAVAHPFLAAGAPFAPAPQLRYTVANRWLVLKARRNDPRGNEQFYDVCEEIAGHPEFAGAALGPADARIGDARSHTTGNASTWRGIGTAHHLDFVVRRITTLGEP